MSNKTKFWLLIAVVLLLVIGAYSLTQTSTTPTINFTNLSSDSSSSGSSDSSSSDSSRSVSSKTKIKTCPTCKGTGKITKPTEKKFYVQPVKAIQKPPAPSVEGKVHKLQFYGGCSLSNM